MEITKAEYITSVVKYDAVPDKQLPQYLFCGRSNVGKSSFINALVGQKNLARTSQNPGKTRTINFYNVENKLHFVDLPGYGYARASKTEIAKWGKIIEEYLLERPQLKSIIMLIDIRHEPTANDKMMYDWLNHYGYKIIIVATKSDKLKRSQINKHLSVIRKSLNLTTEHIFIPFSSQTKDGKDKLWQVIEDIIKEGE